MTQYWKFAEIPRKEELSFNKVLEKFYDYGVDGLVRENIQNSLDGKIPNSPHPVKVKIIIGTMNKDQIPGFNEIKTHIQSLQAGNSYTKETLDHMMHNLKNKVIPYISFEDVNTRGLSGAINGQNPQKGDTWSAYAYSKGVHHVDSNDAFEMSRGGSHGIGKIASNSASDIYLMFFSNCDENGEKHIGGTIQLIDHDIKTQSYRATGYFTNQVGDNFFPYTNDFDSIFAKNNRGLKIIIPFLRSQFNDEEAILRSVCDNFFVAILENKLSVIINGHTIDKDSIRGFIRNPKYYEQDKASNKKEFTQLYLETYDTCAPRLIEIKDLRNAYKFQLYFNYEKNIQKGRVGIIRTIGMKIEDKRIINNVNKPFNALLIPDSGNEDVFLKSLENESHTELSSDHLKDQTSQKNAVRFIRNISKEIGAIIEDAIRENNPIEGKMNTEDVLFEANNSFRDSMSKSTSSLKIDTGKKKRTVVKTVSPTGNGSKKTIKKNIRKTKNKGSSKLYYVHPNVVKRSIIQDKEILHLNLENEKVFKSIERCNIHISVIDGMGKEYENEMNIIDHYAHITDISSRENIKSERNTILKVPIINNRINLSLATSKSFNRSLKYTYYLEVE